MAGADFLWLVLQHVLPKGFRRARNFGFLHPNCKRLIALLHLLLKFVPVLASAWVKERAPIPALSGRARPTTGSDRGKHDLTLVVRACWAKQSVPAYVV